jgi:hypothetical protein
LNRTRFFLPLTLAAFTLSAFLPISAATVFDGPTSTWTAIGFATTPQFGDPISDQQTGDEAADFVGLVDGAAGAPPGGLPAFYLGFDNGLDADLSDGTLMFRARVSDLRQLGAQPPDFGSVLLVGIDWRGSSVAAPDGAVDFFIVSDHNGGDQGIKVYLTTCGSQPCNISPSTTAISTTSLIATITHTASTLNYQEVSVPGLDSNNPNQLYNLSGSETDAFLSVAIPFDTLVTLFNGQDALTFNSQTEMRFLFSTSNQENALNQDLGGCSEPGSATSYLLCGFSEVYSAEDFDTPEPGTLGVLGLGLGLIGFARRKRLI